MLDTELQQLRRAKWRLDGKSIQTIEQARGFLEEVGFCLMYPRRPVLLVPTFIGAFVGSDENLPEWQHAFKDPRTAEATELMVRLLRGKAAYEANLFEENNGFLVAASIFPYFYAVMGERNPKQAPKAGTRSPYSQLASDAYAVIEREGPISKAKLLERLSGGLSLAALDKALAELWSKLRITRVDYGASGGSVWDLLHRWAPDAVKEGVETSVPEALTALVSKYLDCVVAVEQSEVEVFFGNFVPRSKVRDAIHALLAARELSFVAVGGKSMLQITPEKVEVVPTARPADFRRERPWRESPPPNDRKPSQERRPGADRRPSSDRRPFGDRKSSNDRRPSSDRRPRWDRTSPGERKPAGRRSPDERRPRTEQGSPADSRPPGERRPTSGPKPPGGRRAPTDRRPRGPKRDKDSRFPRRP